DYEGARSQGPRASDGVDPTSSNDQPVVAMAERENGAPPDNGVPALEEAVLGSASLGARVLLLQFWKRGRQGDREVHRGPEHRSGRGFPSRWLSPSTS